MSSPACSSDRVTTIRLPKSGRSSNQRRCSPQPGDGADHQQRRHAVAGAGRDVAERSLNGFLRRQRAVVDERRALVGRPAVRQQSAW